MSERQKITTFLWFDDVAEEAVDHYTSIFANSEILEVSRYGKAGPGPEGSVMTVRFELEGQQFVALNGGPQFKFNEAISLVVDCDTQAEVDELWSKLCEGGEEGPCGWLKDRYGLSWQVVPSALFRLMQTGDAESSRRVMQALLKMKKLDIAALEAAYAGEQDGPPTYP